MLRKRNHQLSLWANKRNRYTCTTGNIPSGTFSDYHERTGGAIHQLIGGYRGVTTTRNGINCDTDETDFTTGSISTWTAGCGYDYNRMLYLPSPYMRRNTVSPFEDTSNKTAGPNCPYGYYQVHDDRFYAPCADSHQNNGYCPKYGRYYNNGLKNGGPYTDTPVYYYKAYIGSRTRLQ